jgi:hypothetical protein
MRYKVLILLICGFTDNDIHISGYIALNGGLMNPELERM